MLDRFGIATAAGTRDMALYQNSRHNAEMRGQGLHLPPTAFKPLFTHDVHRVAIGLTSGFGDGERRIQTALLPHAVLPA